MIRTELFPSRKRKIDVMEPSLTYIFIHLYGKRCLRFICKNTACVVNNQWRDTCGEFANSSELKSPKYSYLANRE